MSRKLFAFFLRELGTVRLICQRPHCGGITEITVEKVVEKYKGTNLPHCPICTGTFTGVGSAHNNQLVNLAESLINLKAVSSALEIEFVLPDPTDAAK